MDIERIYGCRIAFLDVPVFFVDDCSAVRCDSDAFVSRAELKSFYPTILHLVSSLLQCSPFDNSVGGSQPWLHIGIMWKGFQYSSVDAQVTVRPSKDSLLLGSRHQYI